MKFRTIEQVQADLNRRLLELYASKDTAGEAERLEHLRVRIDDALYHSNIHDIKAIIKEYNA